MPPLPTLVCKQCGFVNEGERVYCHGCGAKLDRDVIAARQQEKIPSPEERRREVQKIMSPRRGFGGRSFRALLQTLAVAAVVAVFVTFGHAPQGALPLDAKKELVETPPLEEMVEHYIALPVAQRRSLGEKEVTLFLRNERFRNVPSWVMEALALKRVYVNFEEGQARLTVGALFLGYPLYAGWTCYFEKGPGGALSPVCTGGFIGRMPIHPKLAQRTVGALPVVVGSAEHAMKLIARLDSVQFAKEQVIFGTREPVTAAASAPAARPPVAGAPSAKKSAAPSASAAPLQAGFR
ncbi:MAG: hypothetical protein ACFUZC_21590 [Chthoniobacteraceae bacterium]